VLVVEGGRIVEDGDPRELMADEKSRYRALVEADERVRRELWSAAHWRNIRVADGRVEELSGTP
jgi:ATP-binding cassette subfamily B protein